MEVLDENRSHQLIKINVEFVEALEHHLFTAEATLMTALWNSKLSKNFFRILLRMTLYSVLHLQKCIHELHIHKGKFLSFVWLLASAISLSAGLSHCEIFPHLCMQTQKDIVKCEMRVEV